MKKQNLHEMKFHLLQALRLEHLAAYRSVHDGRWLLVERERTV